MTSGYQKIPSFLYLFIGHLGIQLKQLLEPFGVVFETATDVDALQHFIVAFVGGAKVIRHGVGIVEVGNGGGKMCFAGQQNVFSAAGEISFVLFGQRRNGEGVPRSIQRAIGVFMSKRKNIALALR